MSAIGSVQNSWVRSQVGFTQSRFERDRRVYQVFSKKPLDTMTTIFIHSAIVNETVDAMVKIANEKIEPFPDKKISFPSEFVMEKIHLFMVDVRGLGEIQDLTGVLGTESSKCVALAREIAIKQFGNTLDLPASSADAIEERAYDLLREATDYMNQSVGSVRSEVPVAFSDEQLALFGMSRGEITQDPKLMPCFTYALLYVGEVEARDYIFKEGSAAVFYDLFNLLTRWNYYSVPNPDKGDLVVYMTADGVGQHMGVFVEDQLVHSKPGHLVFHAYTHKLFDVVPEYGNQVIFFRKGPGLNL